MKRKIILTMVFTILLFYFLISPMVVSSISIHKNNKNLDNLIKTLEEPNDPKFWRQWPLEQDNDCDIDIVKTWDITMGNPEIVIAVIDTGVKYDHLDLKNNLWVNDDEIAGNGKDDDENGYIDDIHGWNFKENNTDLFDRCSPRGHGTQCASIIGAEINNNLGIAGIAGKCKIMIVCDGDTSEDSANAIKYAADNEADIISMSWGGMLDESCLKDEIDYAYYTKNVVLVAAAGNQGSDTKLYPAAYNNVIAVAGTDQYDKRAIVTRDQNPDYPWSSSYGDWVDVAAPAIEIFCILGNGFYSDHNWYCSGTSFACPHVTGIIALLKSNEPDLSNEEVITRIKNSVDMIETDKYIGTGRINAYCALSGTPGKPYKPTGPSQIQSNIEYTYNSSGLDPNEDKLFYLFDWGDGTNSGWLGPYIPGYNVSAKHIWTSKGTYKIKVKTKDTTDKESEWSNTQNIVLQRRSKFPSIFYRFFVKHFYFFTLFNQIFLLNN